MQKYNIILRWNLLPIPNEQPKWLFWTWTRYLATKLFLEMEESSPLKNKSSPDKSRIQKYTYLVELINQLKKLRELEIKFIRQKWEEDIKKLSKFDDLESQMVHRFMYLEVHNDKANREIREHQSIIQSANMTKEMIRKSFTNIQQIREEEC